MYTPEEFRVTDEKQMHALMRTFSFATLISSGADGLNATHLPTVLKIDEAGCCVIECHVARANTHWKDFETKLPALIVFHGVDGYIRPNWYPSKAEHGKVVPTWNYVAVHAHGVAQAIHDPVWLEKHVTELTAQYEDGEPKPWATSDAPSSYIKVMLRGIVGFSFVVTRLEGKSKMGQNRNHADREGVVSGLRSRSKGDDLEIAKLIDLSDSHSAK